jgi:DNA-3-methyladenine glycosylase
MDEILGQHAEVVAKQILGWKLVKQEADQQLVGRIVETEAYDQADAASHSYRGVTPRTSVMFGPAGFAYVYFTYGMHYCFNVVTGRKGHGSAVLIRALEPQEGTEIMAKRRKKADLVQLTNGPAKLCQAYGIDKSLNGHKLDHPPLLLVPDKAVRSQDIVTATRIGITQDSHRLWRFYIRDNPFVSKP